MSMDPGGQQSAGVLITIGQVYSEVTGMRQEVRDLAHSVQAAVGQLSDHEQRLRAVEPLTPAVRGVEKDLASLEKRLDEDLESRLRSLERWRWGTAGVVAVVLVGGGWAVAWLSSAR